MISLDSNLLGIVKDSENALVLHEYSRSESLSEQALRGLVRVTELDSKETSEIAERASIVFIQSVYESSKFSAARPLLCSAFGSLELVPANPLLLWISLALETSERRNADALVLSLLKQKASRKSGWSREHYLTLLHIYTTEILLKTLRDRSEVQLWLKRQHFLPLDPRERQFLEYEIDCMAESEAPGMGPRLSEDDGSKTPRHSRVSSSHPKVSPFFNRRGSLSRRSEEKSGRISLDVRSDGNESSLETRMNSLESGGPSNFDWSVAPVPVENDEISPISENEIREGHRVEEDPTSDPSERTEEGYSALGVFGTLQYGIFRYLLRCVEFLLRSVGLEMNGETASEHIENRYIPLGVFGLALVLYLRRQSFKMMMKMCHRFIH